MIHTIRNAGFVPQGALVAGVFVAMLSLFGFVIAPTLDTPEADMRIEPGVGYLQVGELFSIEVVVESTVPVNVFRGEVEFDPIYLTVEKIDYNTSIADLWAELPWYENGEGTITFAGGTTRAGGFEGTGSLITVTFRTLQKGYTALRLDGARILKHDGLGTDTHVAPSIDALFTVTEETLEEKTVAVPAVSSAKVAVSELPPSTDVNSDGKQTIADISIFIRNMFGSDQRYDFNMDGKIDTKDLSIIMSAK